MTEYNATREFLCLGVDCDNCYYKVNGEWHTGCWLIEHYYLYDGTSKFNPEIYRVMMKRHDHIEWQKKQRPHLWDVIKKYFGAKLG